MGSVEWRDVVGYEGIYQVSNYGEVYSFRTNKILLQQLNNKGYYTISLYDKNGHIKKCFVHRLVAEAFIPHSEKYDTVNHLDFNPKNNNVENLEWTDRNGNMHYSAVAGHFRKEGEWKKKIVHKNRVKGKSVLGRNLESGEYIFFECLNDSAKQGFTTSSVSQVCNGIRKSHKGYTFRFLTEEEEKNWKVKRG